MAIPVINAVTTLVGATKALNPAPNTVGITITHIGIGDAGGAGYTIPPRTTQASLVNEIVRKPISQSQILPDSFQLDMAALFDGTEQLDVWEIGFYDDVGDLVMVWSSTTAPLVHKAASLKLILGVSLVVVDLNIGNITIQDTGVNLGLFLAGDYAVFLKAIADNATAQIEMKFALIDAGII